jgi:hypothetical protein
VIEAIGRELASGLPPVGVFSVIDNVINTEVAKDFGLKIQLVPSFFLSFFLSFL